MLLQDSKFGQVNYNKVIKRNLFSILHYSRFSEGQTSSHKITLLIHNVDCVTITGVGLSILTGSVVNVSVNISHHEQVLYTQEEKNVSPDTDAVLPIYFNKPVTLEGCYCSHVHNIKVNVTGTGHGRGGDGTNGNDTTNARDSYGGRAQVNFNLKNISKNCIISEIYFKKK